MKISRLMKTKILCAIIGLSCGIFSAQADWVVDASALAAHGGGASSQSFATRAEAQAFINRYPGNGLSLVPGGSDRQSAAAVQNNNQVANAAIAKQAAEEQARREADAKATAEKAAHDAEIARQFEKTKKEISAQLKGIESGLHDAPADSLKGISDSPSAPQLKEIGSSPTPLTPSNVPKPIEDSLTKVFHDVSPDAMVRLRNGWSAVMLKDWHLADAYFKDALNHDPGNPQLIQFVKTFQEQMKTPVPPLASQLKSMAASAKDEEALKGWWIPSRPGQTVDSDPDWRSKAQFNRDEFNRLMKDLR